MPSASEVEFFFGGGNEFVDVDSFKELVEVDWVTTGAGSEGSGALDEATSW